MNRNPIVNLPIIVINGKGGCGKDSLIAGLKSYRWWTVTLSAVDQVKEAAKILGWDGVTKEDRDRKFLHDLKNLSTDYNSGPNTYLYKKVAEIADWCFGVSDEDPPAGVGEPPIPIPEMYYTKEFVDSGAVFIHCREPENIADLVQRLGAIAKNLPILVSTLIVRRADTDAHVYGNHCDDDVYDYVYDYSIDNNGTLEEGIAALNDIIFKIKGIK